ncbi:hypothetical protein V1520DRAFT_303144 [Lipomyces starkeyi]|uniref:Mediator of RNA polymerase II transcription subunit 12 n=1 Tax=Lipomyces starkeyi NRRL Y-11557 TaxID=675824 RepID=A0A1E3Q860_LIPST|nr:hypothetical protein LIPSTDRAFT_274025 [Lipomyces starkeyi NRRL Y-11557]
MYSRSGLLKPGPGQQHRAENGTTPYARPQGQPPPGAQQLPNGPQNFARQPQHAQQMQKSQNMLSQQQQQLQQYGYGVGTNFQSHPGPQASQSQPQQSVTAAAAANQRRHLSSPFPVSHGPGTPGTPTGTSGTSPSRGLLSGGGNGRDDSSMTTYYMTPPADLQPLLKDNPDAGYPDFFPWTGTHGEDSLTESYIQHGFEDKPFLANETGSARPTLYASLRQKASLAALSTFMMNAIDKRQELNKITPPTTFKPPPRVTLTDHKREAWLRDLASPSVPLRRLSRTIPHGIRNRVLVEQCCNKAVPIHRAVWFARCVGANELRGLKRRGTHTSISDAETQWVREWTIQLSAFIEKVISDCGQPGDTATKQTVPIPKWRERMDYVIRFASHLYSEDLIDRNLFLDWTITQFEKSSPERIPISLLFVRIFWPQIVTHQIKSRKLAEALLHHIKFISGELDSQTPHGEVYQQLLHKLSTCVYNLSCISSDAFLVPENWPSIRPVLQRALAMVSVDNGGKGNVFENIALANMRLAHQQSLLSLAGDLSKNSEEEHRERLLVILRNATAPYDIDQISDELLIAVSMPPASYDGNDYNRLVRVLCEWAVCGLHGQTERIDLVTSLLKKWVDLGRPVFDSLFTLFDGILDMQSIDLDGFKIFLKQLLEKQVFRADYYIRRVIARGIFLLPALKDKFRCHGFILAHLPLDEYPKSLQNQRDILLRTVPQEEPEQKLN